MSDDIPHWAGRYDKSSAECSLCGKRQTADCATFQLQRLVQLGWWFHPDVQHSEVCPGCFSLIREARDR